MENNNFKSIIQSLGYPVFEFDINEVSQISLVDKPAIEETFIQFSSNQIKLDDLYKFSQPDKSKRIVYGAAMIANLLIERNASEQIPFPHYVYYTPEKVEEQAHQFMLNNLTDAANLQHSDTKNNAGAKLVESFVTKEKITHRGLEFQPHTWVTGWKILNDDVWNEYIQTGKVKGFSVEATGQMIPVKFQNENKTLELESDKINQITEILKKEGYI